MASIDNRSIPLISELFLDDPREVGNCVYVMLHCTQRNRGDGTSYVCVLVWVPPGRKSKWFGRSNVQCPDEKRGRTPRDQHMPA